MCPRTTATFSSDISYSSQPGGFEGFLPVLKHPQPHDFLVAELEELEELPVNLDTAAFAAPILVNSGQNMLTEVGQLLHFHAELLPCADPYGRRPSDAFVSVVDRCPRLERRWRKLNIGIEAGHARLEVAPGVGVMYTPDDLHVLLGHRPRSISRRTGSDAEGTPARGRSWSGNPRTSSRGEAEAYAGGGGSEVIGRTRKDRRTPCPNTASGATADPATPPCIRCSVERLFSRACRHP